MEIKTEMTTKKEKTTKTKIFLFLFLLFVCRSFVGLNNRQKWRKKRRGTGVKGEGRSKGEKVNKTKHQMTGKKKFFSISFMLQPFWLSIFFKAVYCKNDNQWPKLDYQTLFVFIVLQKKTFFLLYQQRCQITEEKLNR